MPYRLRAKQLFLTYPQCAIPKEAAYDFFDKRFSPLKILVAQEEHKNGDPHLHIYLKLSEEFQTADATALDIIAPPFKIAHGSYEGARSAKNVVKYCSKDGLYKSNFDISMMTQSQTTRKQIGKRLLEGEDLTTMIPEYPHLIFGYKRLKEDIGSYVADAKDDRGSLPPFLPNPWGKVLPSQKKAKRRHYWIYSQLPNKGKTTMFAEPLAKDYRCYIKCGDFSYWNVCGHEEAIILDEYNTAGLKWSSLNSLCDGNYEFRVFMGGLIKLRRPLIIILSNQSIADLYPHMNILLYARFKEIEIL